ncbi:MAG: hypothetical protein JSV39_04995 [Candidatus Aenigmatarchaeota archaeon]|nr:MAG: hypothetical protein JSV39_04995 [Candidatus Aenigmarchaeota archaeon]
MDFAKISGAILFLLAFNCFFWPVQALNLDYYGIESRINNDMTVSNVITLSSNSSVPNLDYKLKYRVFNVLVESEHAPVECETQVTDTSLISCSFTDFENYDRTGIKIQFDTIDIVKVVDENYDFSHFVLVENGVDIFFNIVFLPETAILVADVPNESFSPGTGNTLSDGKHIMIYWDREDLKKGEDLYFSVTYKMPVGSPYDIGIMVVIAVLIIVSLGVVYMRTTHRHRSVKVIMPLLKGDEKIVVEILSKHEGSVNQRVIVRESDFSKAKVSRLVAGLKERGIIDVEVLGRTNKVTLKVKR